MPKSKKARKKQDKAAKKKAAESPKTSQPQKTLQAHVEDDSDTDSDATVVNLATSKAREKQDKVLVAKKKPAQTKKTSQPREDGSDSDSGATVVDNTSKSCKVRLSLVLPPLESSNDLVVKPRLPPSAFSEYCNMCKSLATRTCIQCRLVSYCDNFCESLDQPQHKKLCKCFLAGQQYSDDKRPSPEHRRLLHLQYHEDIPQLFWAKTNMSQTQDTDISGVEVTSKTLRHFMEESGIRQDPKSEAYCRITDDNDPLSVLVVYSLKDPCKPGQPPGHVNRTVCKMADNGFISPMIGPLIVFACVRTAGGATRMVDILPRDIRRVTAFFTMYRPGNPAISIYPGLYPFRSCQGVMISQGSNPYTLELANDDYTLHMMQYSTMELVDTPIDSPHSSYPVSLAFAVGLPWYLRRIWPMGNDAGWSEHERYLASAPQPVANMEKSLLQVNCLTPLKWLRHVTYKEKTTGRFRTQKPFLRGSTVIFNGNLHAITKKQLWCFHRYLDDCLDKGIMPSEDGEDGFKSYWADHSDGKTASPYDKQELLGGDDVFNPCEKGQQLRKIIRAQVARCWEEAKSDYSQGKWLAEFANATPVQMNALERFDE